ncbi:MAG: hypothetical protein A2946_02300 [Candidatus Liptonbacteria bacterium RIFCSPLOWO2_01_FULL_53_13]|uniref:Uncharacterized protein n=1 Tax=Candidatus Liptonbacteria bacterium RIFCSPLOWO2_01_FULL_53_13 TaxID=1798651 RepID=A0A1G2CJH1_9BACT|nr:MAG: hypothetical protein A2946_02300 [Candidatus Liptonbacteria bacterium RIFCSPLOWO2_01_FULL_53_13]
MAVKEGDKVRITSTGLEGYLVKIYYDVDRKTNLYVICNVRFDVPPHENPKDINAALRYLEDLPKNIKTMLNCQTIGLDSPDEIEKVKSNHNQES